MTVSLGELWLYAGALVILWVTPGPVFVALTARALSGGFRSAWPLAVGVTIGDIVWPLIAIFGLTWVIGRVENLLDILHWVAAGIFLLMGVGLMRTASRSILVAEGRLTRPGVWPAFSAGVAAVIGNPKAVLFYMGVLPGFFDLSRVNGLDIADFVDDFMDGQFDPVHVGPDPVLGQPPDGLCGGQGAASPEIAPRALVDQRFCGRASCGGRYPDCPALTQNLVSVA